MSIGNLKGIALLLLSTVCFAGYGVLARPLTQKYKPMELTWVTLMVGCIVFNAASLIRHASSGSMMDYIKPFGDATYLGALAYLAILSTMISTLLASYALTHLEASQMSVFSNLSTLISIVGGAWILHEPVGGYHYVGALLIIAGVLGTNMSGRKHRLVLFSIRFQVEPHMIVIWPEFSEVAAQVHRYAKRITEITFGIIFFRKRLCRKGWDDEEGENQKI